jgi:hypothetical protein
MVRLSVKSQRRRVCILFAALFAAACAVGLSAGAQVSLASGDANEAFCPNEGLAGFVTYLPDCRGYELMSPAFEDGQPLNVKFISEEFGDAPRVIFASLGDAAGTGSETGAPLEPALLEVGRSGDTDWGWQSLTPTPGSEIAGSTDGVVDASADSFAHVGQIFPGGAIEKALITPGGDLSDGEENGEHYMGASKQLDHILFALNVEYSAATPSFRLLWPGDETAGGGIAAQSLYEYSGFKNTAPTLVGVEGKEGSRNLISRCGTELGSTSFRPVRFGSLYNAIADEGQIIFFTAMHSEECASRHPGIKQPAASELWARIDGSSSVAISEPLLPLGSECTFGHACYGATPQEGVFQGASRDGSKVFFLTAQPLVNGDEDHSMDLYEAELEGKGEATKIGRLEQVSADPADPAEAAEVQGVVRISPNGSYVYFVAKGKLAANENAEQKQAARGEDNLYLFERDAAYPAGRVSFVATLSSADSADWSRLDLRPAEINECRPSEECEAGNDLVFLSSAHLTPDDTSETPSHEGLPQLFEYNAATGEMARVSIGERSAAYPEGYNENGNISEEEDIPNIIEPQYDQFDSPVNAFLLSVSSDGSRIVFTTRDALTPDSGSYCANAYEYRSVGPISDGNVYPISDGHDLAGAGPEASEFCGAQQVFIDPSGSDIFLLSGDPLVPGVSSGITNAYDAHEDGGSTVTSVSGCSEEACRPETVPPLLPTAGSVSQSGEAGVGPAVTTPISAKKPKSHKKPKKKPHKPAKRKAGKARRKRRH